MKKQILLLFSLTACKGAEVPTRLETAPQSAQQAAQQQSPKPEPAQPTRTLAAAGVSISLPSNWTFFDEREPDFAMARGPGENPPTCTIEVRRQGLGEPPKGAKSRDVGELDFTRGALRGRMRTLPGPSPSSNVVIQCLSLKAGEWSAIEAAFDSQNTAPPEPAAAPPSTALPIAQLCTGTPSNPTYVCVRRDDGAVYCGVSDGEALVRIAGIEPSVQIACEGARGCSRAASGALECWKADSSAQPVAEIAKARDIAGGCVVDANGQAWCRENDPTGETSETFTKLVPFGNPEFAFADVEQVLPRSGASQGCVLSQGQLRCWDLSTTLRLPLPDNHQVHTLTAATSPTDLAMFGNRVCVAGPERWTCLDGEQRFELDGCDRRPCGCSLLGAMQLSCDHEPLEYGGALFGHIGNVIAIDGACAALLDGTVGCRGPVAGFEGDSARVRELVIGGPPSVLHVLELRESSGPANENEADSK